MDLNNENQVREIFASLNKDSLEPHPFLRTRVLAASKELVKARKHVFYWKLVSAFSMACLALTLVYNTYQSPVTTVALNRPYVIHMNFSEEDASYVASAEIMLPKGVSFHSVKNPTISKARSLKLPVNVSADGRTKLPFVVVASGKGDKKILVRLYDKNNNVVKEDFIKVSFNKKS